MKDETVKIEKWPSGWRIRRGNRASRAYPTEEAARQAAHEERDR